jgi:hypothetical protein
VITLTLNCTEKVSKREGGKRVLLPLDRAVGFFLRTDPSFHSIPRPLVWLIITPAHFHPLIYAVHQGRKFPFNTNRNSLR